jgi:hypothetical protein
MSRGVNPRLLKERIRTLRETPDRRIAACGTRKPAPANFHPERREEGADEWNSSSENSDSSLSTRS